MTKCSVVADGLTITIEFDGSAPIINVSDSTTSEDDKEYARLGRVMRGEAILRLDDVARAQIHFGEQLGLADWVRVS